jgi:hypothetical protein
MRFRLSGLWLRFTLSCERSESARPCGLFLAGIENVELGFRRFQSGTVAVVNTPNLFPAPQKFSDSPQVNRFTSVCPGSHSPSHLVIPNPIAF